MECIEDDIKHDNGNTGKKKGKNLSERESEYQAEEPQRWVRRDNKPQKYSSGRIDKMW